MLDLLPLTVRTEFEIIKCQDSAASMLGLLQTLFIAMNKDKNIKEHINSIEKEIEKRKRSEDQEKEEVIYWIKEKVLRLKQHYIADHYLILPLIEKLDRILNYKLIRSNQNFVCSAWSILSSLINIMVSFGHNEAFEGWVNIGLKTDLITLLQFNFHCLMTEKIALNSEIGRNLTNTLNHGFLNAIMLPPTLYPGKERAVIQFEYGYVESFSNIPKYLEKGYEHSGLQSMLNNHKNNDLKSNPIALYQQLQILAQFIEFIPIELPLKEFPTNWQQIDLISKGIQTTFYLNYFKKQKPPINHLEIVKLVEAFLLFVSRPKAMHVKKRANKEDAKKFIKGQFSGLFERIKRNHADWMQKIPTNEKIYFEILGVAQKAAEPCISEITPRLTADVIRNFLQEKGIKRKGGNKPKKLA